MCVSPIWIENNFDSSENKIERVIFLKYFICSFNLSLKSFDIAECSQLIISIQYKMLFYRHSITSICDNDYTWNQIMSMLSTFYRVSLLTMCLNGNAIFHGYLRLMLIWFSIFPYKDNFVDIIMSYIFEKYIMRMMKMMRCCSVFSNHFMQYCYDLIYSLFRATANVWIDFTEWSIFTY